MNKKSFFQNKKVLITGAGSGIGRATALLLAQYEAHLLLADISKIALAETAELIKNKGADCDSYLVDVSDWDAMQAMSEKVHRQHQVVDILINNAGVGLGGSFQSTSVDDWHWVLGINLMGVVYGCKLFTPAMMERKQGHVVNLASLAGYYAAPDMSAYSASKHAVMGLSESLRAELAAFNIGVSAICPGVINTNIIKNGKMTGATEKSQAKIDEFYQKRNYGPEYVAEGIVNAIVGNKAIMPVSPESWVVYAAKRLSPSLVGRISGSQFLKKRLPA
jgi:short-subunit dehydrogenase